MNTNVNTDSNGSRTISPQVVAAILGIIAFIGPVWGQIYSGFGGADFMVYAMIWVYYYSGGWGPSGNFQVNPFMILTGLLYGALRPVFAYMMYRLYQDKTTKKRAIITGIAAELQIEVIFLISFVPMILFNPYPGGTINIPLVFPIPILILVGLALIKVFPPKVNESWVETEQTAHWWEKTDGKAASPETAEETTPVVEDVEDVTPKTLDDTSPKSDDGWLKDN